MAEEKIYKTGELILEYKNKSKKTFNDIAVELGNKSRALCSAKLLTMRHNMLVSRLLKISEFLNIPANLMYISFYEEICKTDSNANTKGFLYHYAFLELEIKQLFALLEIETDSECAKEKIQQIKRCNDKQKQILDVIRKSNLSETENKAIVLRFCEANKETDVAEKLSFTRRHTQRILACALKKIERVYYEC